MSHGLGMSFGLPGMGFNDKTRKGPPAPRLQTKAELAAARNREQLMALSHRLLTPQLELEEEERRAAAKRAEAERVARDFRRRKADMTTPADWDDAGKCLEPFRHSPMSAPVGTGAACGGGAVRADGGKLDTLPRSLGRELAARQREAALKEAKALWEQQEAARKAELADAARRAKPRKHRFALDAFETDEQRA